MNRDWRERADDPGAPWVRGDDLYHVQIGPPPKSPEDEAAEARTIRHWKGDPAARSPLWQLRLAEALWARLEVDTDRGLDCKPRQEALRSSIGRLLREADPKSVLGDPRLCGLVRASWGQRGVDALARRASDGAAP